MIEVKAYRCSHCGKYGLSKSHISKHVARCFKNPATKSCKTCANRAIVDVDGELVFEFSAFDESFPECLRGREFDYNSDTEKFSFHTGCQLWEERPEEIEELVAHQDAIDRSTIVKIPNEKPVLSTVTETTFFDLLDTPF